MWHNQLSVPCVAENHTISWFHSSGGQAAGFAVAAYSNQTAAVSASGPVDFAMGEAVNLRKVRKQARKQQDAERAAANRLVHGQSKAERTLEARRTDKMHQQLDAHRIDTGDA